MGTELRLSAHESFASIFIYEDGNIRDANLYGLPVVTTENCKNFQFSTDYEKLEFSTGIILKK